MSERCWHPVTERGIDDTGWEMCKKCGSRLYRPEPVSDTLRRAES